LSLDEPAQFFSQDKKKNPQHIAIKFGMKFWPNLIAITDKEYQLESIQPRVEGVAVLPDHFYWRWGV
jgi:hypothetical protein